MTKREFLEILNERTARLSEAERDRLLEYYGEIIDDRMEEGLTEAEAVAALGDPAALTRDYAAPAAEGVAPKLIAVAGRDLRLLLQRVRHGAPGPVEAFKQRGVDFVVRDTLADLVAGMNELTPEAPLDYEQVRSVVEARDREMDNKYTKDLQVAAVRAARAYAPDRIARIAAPHRLLDPKAGPLIAVKLHLLTRKDTESTRALAEQYAWQALQPLIADGRASSVTVAAMRRRAGWISLAVRIEQASGEVATFEHPVKVS